MTIEVRLADMSKSIRKKKCCRKTSSKRKRSPPSPAAISFPLQRLYISCLDVFKGVGTVPSPTDVQKLCHILDRMMPEDVGLSRNLQFFKPRSNVGVTPKVACTTIYQCEEFSLSIFFLPANAVIPLHNHPGMTVFVKLLLGKVHIKAYDLVSTENSDDSNSILPSQPKLASLKANGVFTAPCDTSVLYPTSGGNIHAFKAITPCAILDVMGPPYSKKDGRDCSYYRDIPYTALPYERAVMSGEESERYWWLEEIEVPKESEMEGIEYMGPQIIEMSSS
ncbi:plant cysteine oxidase 1-like [Cynara cardunculus var. scolymus]|uniref:plant cysteine oxidase 1-like n=1 Tax=Cynara cardunculus var. scolymus TaxID=59895 RepID=UPI000D6285E9|nr:plant cysteine oxidase 1-like [Cynara cardunculus var. scolymus]